MRYIIYKKYIKYNLKLVEIKNKEKEKYYKPTLKKLLFRLISNVRDLKSKKIESTMVVLSINSNNCLK